METYVVICRDDAVLDQPGPYVLATRQTFDGLQAAQDYARGIASSREAIIVSGRWHELRAPQPRDEQRFTRPPQPRREPRFPSAYWWK